MPRLPPTTVDSPPLTPERIVVAALTVVERDGHQALSMRRVGAELGVEAMSLYHHVRNRQALLEAVGQRLLLPLARLDLDPAWRRACEQYARGLREVAVAHPAAFRLLGLAPLEDLGVLGVVEALMGRLVGAGFSPSQALGAYRAVASFARGYALAEVAGFTVDAGAEGSARLAALPAADFPILRGRRADLAGLGADAGFEQGLGALLDGLGGVAARARR